MRTPVLAAGGIIWRPASDAEAIEVLLVHRPKYDDWTFPKGKLHQGESLIAAAVREVAEETGLSVIVGHRMRTVSYATTDGPKEVTYWVMQPADGDFAPNAEVDQIRWVPVAVAAEELSYAHDRRLALELTDLPPGVVRVVLVRHADAGQRKDDPAADITRPLSERGADQAHALTPLLTLFAPTRVISAPALRCVQTVEPLADALGLTVEVEPTLGEAEFARDPSPAAELLLAALHATKDTTVISSQGGVIPGLIAGLPSADAPEPLTPVVAKAGVWTLATTGGRVRADYYPPPQA